MKLIRNAVMLFMLIALLAAAALSLGSCSDCLHPAYTDWVTTKAATCSEEGVKERSCIDCKEVFTEKVKKKSHVWGDYLYDGNATCTFVGSSSASCSECGTKTTKKMDGNPFGHSYFDGVCSECADTLTLVASYDASATESDEVTVKVYRSLDGHYELDVVGTGAMKDLAEGESAPWSEHSSNITVLHIYSGVTRLGARVFRELGVLTEVNLEAGLKTVGRCAFPELFAPSITRVYDMATWVGLEFEDEGVPSLYMTGLIYVGKVEVAKDGKKTLTDKSTRIENLILPEGVESIGAYAFYQNRHITTVTLPASLKSIGTYAFYGCGAIEEVYTPSLADWCEISFAERYANPLIYGRNLFVDNKLLSSLTLGEEITHLNRGVFEGCTSIIDLKIKGGLKSIPAYAFYNCSSIRTLEISEGVEEISPFAFYGATSLRSLTLPTSLTTLSSDAFRNCTGLVFLDTGDGLSEICASAFRDCYQLMHLELGTNITSLAPDAFFGCVKIYEIENRSALDISASSLAENALRIYTTDEPTNITVIEQSDDASETVAGAGLVLYRDGDSTLLLGYVGQRDSITLSSETVGGAFSVYKNAFYSTTLSSVTVGEGINKMHDGAFIECTLGSVRLTSLEAFCAIVFESETANPLYYAVELYLGNNDKQTYKVVIPDGVSVIGDYAFAGLGQITEFTIPSSVKSIGRGAFLDCISAAKTAGGISYVGKWIVGTDKAARSASIAADTVGAAKGAFDGCTVTAFVLGAKHLSLLPAELVSSLSVTGGTLTADAFAPFSSLEAISINSSVTLPEAEFTSVGATSLSAPKSALALFKSLPLTSLTIVSGSITRSDVAPFSSLQSIAIESGVKSVEAGAFKDLTTLTSASIRGGLTSLPSELFSGCTSLSEVTLHTGITSIEKDTFRGCTSLIKTAGGVSYAAGWVVGADENAESIVLSADTVGVANGVFASDSSLKTVYYLERQTAYNKIKLNSKANPAIVSAKVYFFIETLPSTEGSFWHYVDGVPTLW